MRAFAFVTATLLGLSVLATGCSHQPGAKKTAANVTRVDAGADAQKRAQTALINAKPGEVIEFGEGRFDFNSTLSLEDVSDVTIRGQGADKTILSFTTSSKAPAAKGLRVKCKENVTDRGPGRRGCQGGRHQGPGHQADRLPQRPHRMDRRPEGDQRRLRLLPRAVHGRADRGLRGDRRVGRRHLRRPVGEHHRPPQSGGKERGRHRDRELRRTPTSTTTWPPTTPAASWSSRCPTCPRRTAAAAASSTTQVVGNNHDNFAPKGNIVATVPPGTGMMIMANDQVEFFDNTVENNNSTGLLIVSYLIKRKPIKDDKYDPYCEAIYIHDNKFAATATARPATWARSWARSWARRCRTSCTTAFATRKSWSTASCPRPSGFGFATTAMPNSSISTAARSTRPPCSPTRSRTSSAT